MNINSLFEKQQYLDEHIIKEKDLHGQDLLKRKTVALICELYECINEARFFKFWSDDQKPNTEGNKQMKTKEGRPAKGFVKYNPLLEEYADTIHFALSIANDLGYHEHKYIKTHTRDLNDLVIGITNIATIIPMSKEKHHVSELINNVIQLGYQLGFTEEEVINAYNDKNKVNYERQQNGY